MKPDLDQYTLEELTTLKKDVEAAISSFNARALAHARGELEKTAKSMGNNCSGHFTLCYPVPEYKLMYITTSTFTRSVLIIR